MLALLSGCVALAPSSRTVEERVSAFAAATGAETTGRSAARHRECVARPANALVGAGLPRSGVRIWWSRQQIPFIDAQSEQDLAYSLGLVHAHLRGGQLALYRRIAQGRLSESVGPFARQVDHSLRILDFGRAAPAIIAGWPASTRAWVEAFTAGLNAYEACAPRPPEAGLLALRPEPWSAEDVVTLGRLAGTDINWLAMYELLPERNGPGWPEEWRRTMAAGIGGPELSAGRDAEPASRELLAAALRGTAQAGSNAAVVSAERSASGAPLLATDPHLGLSLPNNWLVAGIRAPGVHAVGLMLPGVPFIAVGRNADVAWGGTNLRAASSELYDVARLPPEAIETRQASIRSRGWWTAERPVRRSTAGPIISDGGLFAGRPGEELALRWVGHERSDEVSAFLAANRARDAGEFARSFASFAVSGQALLVADRHGTIGLVPALWQPERRTVPPTDLVLAADDPTGAWRGFRTAADLPPLWNPRAGFIASANSQPPQIAEPLGWFRAPPDRLRRLEAALAGRGTISADDLAALQTDVGSPPASGLARALLAELAAAGLDAAAPALLRRLRGWDGGYQVTSVGAPAFELLLTVVAGRLYGGAAGEVADHRQQWGYLSQFLIEDLRALPPRRRAALLGAAVADADRQAAEFRQWGDMHRLRLGHLLAAAPVIGRAFALSDLPYPGSRETLLKSAHDLETGRHDAQYGAQARLIADLADQDTTRIVLLGGQDGWLGSTTAADQVPLWLSGRYLDLPFRLATIERRYPFRTDLAPRQSPAAPPPSR